LTGWTTLTGQHAFEAPGAMRALCEIDRELDHDAAIHRVDIAAHGKHPVPVLASGGGAQTLPANYAPMCEEIAIEVTGHLVPDAGHWVGEENPDYFCRMFIEFDTSPEPDSSISSIAG
jgi:pimeloyl-ACP methyl ester carboxylesterase